MQVDGVKAVIRGFETKRKKDAKAVERGVVKATLFLQRESQLIVPVDTGNLRNSANTRKFGSGFKTVVIFGYTASYGIYVHEDLYARHKPGKTAKFVERPVRQNLQLLFEIIWQEVNQ